jgi:hypothetical protein
MDISTWRFKFETVSVDSLPILQAADQLVDFTFGFEPDLCASTGYIPD